MFPIPDMAPFLKKMDSLIDINNEQEREIYQLKNDVSRSKVRMFSLNKVLEYREGYSEDDIIEYAKKFEDYILGKE